MTKVRNLKAFSKPFSFQFYVKHGQDFCHKRAVLKVDLLYVGTENLMFAGFVCTFQPESCTGWGSEGVNILLKFCGQTGNSLSDDSFTEH